MKLPLLKKMNEAAWLLGIIFCALGVCLLTKAGFGLSMVSAAAYILHLKVVQFLPFFSQGMSEYVFQALLLLVLCLAIQRFNWRYLLSFASAVIFGFVLDGWYLIFGSNAVYTVFWVRVFSFVLGELFTAISIAFFFRTGWPLEIYELFLHRAGPPLRLEHEPCKTVLRYCNANPFGTAGANFKPQFAGPWRRNGYYNLCKCPANYLVW